VTSKKGPYPIQGVLYDTGWGYQNFLPDENGNEVQAELLTVTEATLLRMDHLERHIRPSIVGDTSR